MRPITGSQQIYRKLSIQAKSRSTSVGPRYNGIHTQNSERNKASIEEIYKQRSSRKSSIEQLERNRRFIKSAKSSRSVSLIFDVEEKNKPINLKYHSIVYENKPYNYSNLYFPARRQYVKTSRKIKESFFTRTHKNILPNFQSFNVIENFDEHEYYHKLIKYSERDACIGAKCKVAMKTKFKEGLKRLKYESTAKEEEDYCVSPWDTIGEF